MWSSLPLSPDKISDKLKDLGTFYKVFICKPRPVLSLPIEFKFTSHTGSLIIIINLAFSGLLILSFTFLIQTVKEYSIILKSILAKMFSKIWYKKWVRS